jgi:hypothetical protein
MSRVALAWGKVSIGRPLYAECCKAGDVDIPFLHDLPSSLRPFFDRPSREFKENIHLYNKALAFTSTGGTGHPVPFSGDGRGPPFYKIQGEVHHRIGPLRAEDGVSPVFSQLYVYHHDEALHYRTRNNPERDHDTMAVLQMVLKCCNPFVAVYEQACDLSDRTSVLEYRIQLDFRKCTDRRRYNSPLASQELALIIPGDEHARECTGHHYLSVWRASHTHKPVSPCFYLFALSPSLSNRTTQLDS